jgi:hypothetical protein
MTNWEFIEPGRGDLEDQLNHLIPTTINGRTVMVPLAPQTAESRTVVEDLPARIGARSGLPADPVATGPRGHPDRCGLASPERCFCDRSCPEGAARSGAGDVEILTASRPRRSRSAALRCCRRGKQLNVPTCITLRARVLPRHS